MKIYIKRIIGVLLLTVMFFSNTVTVFSASVGHLDNNDPIENDDQTENTDSQAEDSTYTKTLYRYREKIETSSYRPLDEPWTLISKEALSQFLFEFTKANPSRAADIKETYPDEYYSVKETVDGREYVYNTRLSGGGITYYFDKLLPDYGMYDETKYTYSEHPTTGVKIYYMGTCDTYTISVYTRYEYRYWKWSEWSAWSETPCTASDFVEVETKESDILYRYSNKKTTTSTTTLEEPWVLYDKATDYTHSSFSTVVLKRTASIGSYCVHGSVSVYKFIAPDGGSWFYATYDEYTKRLVNNPSLSSYRGEAGYLRYTICTKKTAHMVYYYYMWEDWSEWSYTPVTESDDVRVETKHATVFTVSYDANGGAGAPEAVTKEYDATIVLSDLIPVRENHEFLGWSTAADGEVKYSAGDSYSDNADVTLYAVWKNITEYSLSYDPNGGTGGPAAQSKLHSENVTLAYDIPSREGYSFLGWSLSSTGEAEYLPGDMFDRDESVTLYAIWQKNEYIIFYDANGGSNAPDYQVKEHGDDIVITSEEPTREEYIFLGWATTAEGEAVYGKGDTFSNDQNTVLYAVWSHIHTWNEGEITVPATHTEDGEITYSCTGCDATKTEVIAAEGHTWSDWMVTQEPTTSAEGEKLRYCTVCRIPETEKIPAIKIEISTCNYTISITGADKITHIRYASGIYESAADIKNAADCVDLSASVIGNNTEDNIFSYEMTRGGVYSLWIKISDGSTCIMTADLTVMEQELDVYGVTVTVKNLYGVKDFFIAKGEYDNYNDIKANYFFNVTSAKIGEAHDYKYILFEPGTYTICVRYDDVSRPNKYITFNAEALEPVFKGNGLQLNVANIDDIKVIRTAYGEYSTPGEIKRAKGSRAFTGKGVLKGLSDYTVQYRDNGIVSVAVVYNNGYEVMYTYNVEKKTPSFTHIRNTVIITELDDLKLVRYAEGEYTTSNQIKNALGSKVLKSDSIVGGYIILELEVGTYSFCVQYNDESYNYYTVTVN